MNDMIKNKVTIVIPTYNSVKTINNTLNILIKIFKNIIVVDGQSRDLTRETCKK